MKVSYGYKIVVNMSFEEAKNLVVKELKDEGFGLLTEINVKETLKKKIGVEYEKYVILGVCNPHFAYKALTVEKDIGLFLPCNIIIYEENNKVVIAVIKPSSAMSVVDNKKLAEIALIAEKKLISAIKRLEDEK